MDKFELKINTIVEGDKAKTVVTANDNGHEFKSEFDPTKENEVNAFLKLFLGKLNAGEEKKNPIEVGSKVKVTDIGERYSTYDALAKRLLNTDDLICYGKGYGYIGQQDVGKTGKVIAINAEKTIAAVLFSKSDITSDYIHLYGVKGLEVVDE